MKCVRGRLFTVDGLIEDEGQIGNLILEEISGVLTANLSKTVANLLASIKLQACKPAGQHQTASRIRRRCPLKPTASTLPTGRISWTAASPPTRATATTA